MMNKKNFLILFALLAAFSSLLFLRASDMKKQEPELYMVGVGFPRCGTSGLFEHLEKHPDFHRMKLIRCTDQPGTEGEIFYWGKRSSNFWVIIRDSVTHTRKIFRPTVKYYQHMMHKHKPNIEKSPQYITYPGALKDLSKKYPNVKILIQLRNPIDYLGSFYHKTKSEEKGISFEQFIASKNPNTNEKLTFQETGRYSEFIKKVYKYFPKENVQILLLDDLVHITDAFSLCDLLKLPRPEENYEVSFKKNDYHEKIKPETLEALNKYYKDSNEELFELLGRRIEGWE